VLRTNLSTRPFYNERAVHFVIAVIAALVLALTLLNAQKLIRLSRHNTELSSRIASQRSEAERLTREATRIRHGIDPKELALVAAEAREANTLIDQRTFSWTDFFNQIETTLPPDVMLTAVRPTVTEAGTSVSMVALARNADDFAEFMEKLEATGAFDHVLPRQQDQTDDGLHRLVIETDYVPTHEPAPKAEATKSGGGRP
jgi:Tfp pilus assembly protein PilN